MSSLFCHQSLYKYLIVLTERGHFYFFGWSLWWWQWSVFLRICHVTIHVRRWYYAMVSQCFALYCCVREKKKFSLRERRNPQRFSLTCWVQSLLLSENRRRLLHTKICLQTIRTMLPLLYYMKGNAVWCATEITLTATAVWPLIEVLGPRVGGRDPKRSFAYKFVR